MSVLLAIVLPGVGIAIAVAVMAVDLDAYGARRSAAQAEAHAAVHAAECLALHQAIRRGTAGQGHRTAEPGWNECA